MTTTRIGAEVAQRTVLTADILDALADGRACGSCGEPLEADLLELWAEERAFMPMTCCEGSQEELAELMQDFGRNDWELWFRACGFDVRQVYDDGCGALRIDFGLEVREIPQAVAKDFVRAHHRHNPPPAGWRYGAGCFNGHELVAVVMVGRPVARRLDDGRTVEVNRLCSRPDAHPALVWNACSRSGRA